MELISSQLTQAINEQIGHEFSAMLQYVNIATYFDGEALPRLAAHFYRQAEEEKDHAMRLVHYVVEAGGVVTIPATPGTRSEFASAADAVQLALDQEITVTQQINALMDLAIKENDHAAQIMLTWFVTEQIEEVSSMESLLSIIKRAGDSGLFFVEYFLAGGGAATE